MMKTILFALVALVLSCQLMAQQESALKGNAPDQNQKTIDSVARSNIKKRIMEINLADFNNKPFKIDTTSTSCTVINLWATWCPPCVAEISTYNKMMERFKDCNVNFIAISFTEDTAKTREYLKIHPFNFKQLIANRNDVRKDTVIPGLPTTLFMDKKGNILFNYTGVLLNLINFI